MEKYNLVLTSHFFDRVRDFNLNVEEITERLLALTCLRKGRGQWYLHDGSRFYPVTIEGSNLIVKTVMLGQFTRTDRVKDIEVISISV